MPSARTVILAVTSTPGSKFASGSPVPAAALVARPHADDAAVVEEERLADRLGEDHRAGGLRLLGEEAPELGDETIQLPWFIIVGGGGIRSAAPFVSRYTASPCTGP